MYGLPDDVDLRFFHGQTLIQVGIGASDLVLNFHPSVSMTITCSVCLTDPGGASQRHDDSRQAGCATLPLLTQVVTRADGKTDGTLVLHFDGGWNLTVYDDDKHHESYVVRDQGRVVIVV